MGTELSGPALGAGWRVAFGGWSGHMMADGGVRVPGGLPRLQSGWDG